MLDPTGSGKIKDGSKFDKIRNQMSAKSSGLLIGGGVSEKDEQ